MKEFLHREEINKFLKTNPIPAFLNNPFPSRKQLIDHMSNNGNSSSLEEIRMMSSETINLQTQSQNYDKPTDKKEENSSSDKSPLLVLPCPRLMVP